MNILAWLKQPTTVGGIAALSGVLTGVLSGAMSLPVAASTAVGALVAMALPDNTAVVAQSRTAAADLTTLAQTLAPLVITKPTPQGNPGTPTA